MTNPWGIHAPNAGFHRMGEFYDAGFQNYTVLHGNANLIPEIRNRYPDARVLVRMYLQNWFNRNPSDWAREVADIANGFRQVNVELTWANEQNLDLEGHPDGASPQRPIPPASLYQDINRWNLEMIRLLRQLVPWARLHYPAFAGGHSDDQNQGGYVGLEICRPGIELADVMDCHCYWTPDQGPLTLDGGQRFVFTHNLFPDKPIFISECGNFAVEDPRSPEQYVTFIHSLYHYSYVEGATFFIWDSDDAPENARNIIQRSGALVRALREASKDVPAELPPVPVAPAPVRPPPAPPAPRPAPVTPPPTPSVPTPEQPAPVEPVPVSGSTYIVRSGDSLSLIARRFNVTVAALVAANNIADPNRIRVGQRLVIPSPSLVLSIAGTLAAEEAARPRVGVLGIGDPSTPVVTPGEIRAFLAGKRTTYYVARKGDTIPRIAALFRLDPLVLAQLNEVGTAGELIPGTRLIIPMS